ncbi:MAG: thiosulfate oxidation carrier complex protein SoxZ [Alphaproteobacteria bacterium]|nr:thiosulfate oxidation carrier complex protein SoxZ [Alphaproteobacteria bacterium]
MASAKPRIKVPKSAAKGEVIEIKTLISHKMETGLRKDKDGKVIPRQIINKFTCSFNDKLIFSSDWHPAVSANPYMSFHIRATESGKLDFSWHDDNGETYSKSADLTVA